MIPLPGTCGGEEAAVPDGQRHLVVLLLVPKGSGHAATAGIHFFNRCLGQEPEDPEAGAGADEGLLMAMAVQQEGRRRGSERQAEPPLLVQTGQKLLDQEGSLGEPLGPGVVDQVGVLVAKREDAARL